MITIRKYEAKDFDEVHYVCDNAEGPEEVPDEQTGQFIYETFCDYYLDNEPENCFVLDDDGKVVGYMICAENFDKFKAIFDEKYLPLSHRFEGRYEWASTAYIPHEKFKDEYPAHFHINIMPEYQRSGMGGKLVETLIEHLAAKGIKGVCLTCGPRNERAMNFYQKYNFELLSIDHDDACFGKKIK